MIGVPPHALITYCLQILLLRTDQLRGSWSATGHVQRQLILHGPISVNIVRSCLAYSISSISSDTLLIQTWSVSKK